MKLLITGFSPFGGQSINPSWLLAQRVAATPVAGMQGRVNVQALELPTEFHRSGPVLRRAMAKFKPEAVIALGQAGGRAALSFERIAINLADAPIADNAGDKPRDSAVVPNGPAAYWTKLPIRAMADAAMAAGVSAELSQSAGSYVCNHLFYTLMHSLRRKPHVQAGFVHLPLLPEQVQDANTPTMSLASMELGLMAAIQALQQPLPTVSMRLNSGRVA